MTGFDLNMTGFILNMTELFLSMTGFHDDYDKSHGIAYKTVLTVSCMSCVTYYSVQSLFSEIQPFFYLGLKLDKNSNITY